jgi:hypothetical protein
MTGQSASPADSSSSGNEIAAQEKEIAMRVSIAAESAPTLNNGMDRASGGANAVPVGQRLARISEIGPPDHAKLDRNNRVELADRSDLR